MSKKTPVSDEERAQIVEGLREGRSQGSLAREVGRHVSTVNRIAKAEGIESNIAATKKAVDARARYEEAERRQVLNEVMDKGRDLLKEVGDAGEYQKLTVGIATTIDKIRLESGEATSREERIDGNAKDRLRAKLGSTDQLAARRRAREAAGGDQ